MTCVFFSYVYMYAYYSLNVKLPQGNLSGQRQGQPVFITRLEV